jgi:hypothetical protein
MRVIRFIIPFIKLERSWVPEYILRMKMTYAKVALGVDNFSTRAWAEDGLVIELTEIKDRLSEAEKIAMAVAEGYPDVIEICPDTECARQFRNYHHFIRCDRRPCPMSDGKGTLLDRLCQSLVKE